MKKILQLSILLLVIVAGSSCKHEPLPPVVTPPVKTDSLKVGLLAYYKFDNNAADSSGNHYDGTPNNLTSTADRYNNGNAAYNFNGSNSYSVVADKAPLRLGNTDFTLNFWIKLDQYNSFGCNVLSKHLPGNDNGWVIGINGKESSVPGTVRFGPGGTSAGADGKKVIPLYQWHMVTATYSKSTQQITFYVDGVLDDVTNNIPSPNAVITSMLYIGRDEPTASADGYFVKGGLDEVRIYNRVLPQAQITKLYLPAPIQPPPPAVDSLKLDLLAYYGLDNSAVDSSDMGNNATAYNVTATTDRFNKANSAFSFNGENSYLTVQDNQALRLNNTDFTLNMWVKQVAYGGNLLSKHLPGDENGWVIGLTGPTYNPQGIVSFGPGGNSAAARGTKILSLGQWHMITAIYTKATLKLAIYVDGILDTVTDNIPSPNTYTDATLYIGRDDPSASLSGYFLNGSLDEIRIYTRALPETQIQKLLNYKN